MNTNDRSPVNTELTDDAVLIIRMVDDATRNALSRDMQAALLQALSEGRAQGARVAVIRGSPKVFSSGYNVNPNGRSDYVADKDVFADLERLRENVDFLLKLRRWPMPIIAQVRGHCLAGGTDLMLATDVALVADEARIGLPNVRSFGVSLLSTLWPLQIGTMRAKLMMFTGDSITGRQAVDWGLAAMSQPDADLDAGVLQVARRMALTPSDLLAASKAACNRLVDLVGIEALVQAAMDIDVQAHFSTSVADAWDQVRRDGLKTFLRRREARYPEAEALSEVLAMQSALRARENG